MTILISDEELQLKKRSRRRLVGAVVLALTVAVVLPMLLDSEPRSTSPDVQVHIPSTDAPDLKPKGDAVATDAPSPTPVGEGAPQATDKAAAPAPASSVVADTRPISGMPGSDITTPAAAGKDRPKSPEMMAEAPSATNATSASSAELKAEAKPKAPESKSASKAAESKASAKAKAEAKETKAAESKSAETKSAASKSSAKGGTYVVQVAALSDASKARALEQQVRGAGLRTYTEVVTTQTGAMTRVRAGPYSSREAAEKAQAQLKKAGLDGKVVSK